MDCTGILALPPTGTLPTKICLVGYRFIIVYPKLYTTNTFCQHRWQALVPQRLALPKEALLRWRCKNKLYLF
jgi:hypothetical protein